MLNSKKRGQRGVQLIELAIAMPVLLMLLAAMAEFRNYFHHYAALSEATRAAARYLSAKAFTEAEIEKAKNIAVCGDPDSCGAGDAALEGLSTGNIEITFTGGELLPQTVTVRIVGYQYQPVFDLGGWTGGETGTNFELKPSTTMRYTLEN